MTSFTMSKKDIQSYRTFHSPPAFVVITNVRSVRTSEKASVAHFSVSTLIYTFSSKHRAWKILQISSKLFTTIIATNHQIQLYSILDIKNSFLTRHSNFYTRGVWIVLSEGPQLFSRLLRGRWCICPAGWLHVGRTHGQNGKLRS